MAGTQIVLNDRMMEYLKFTTKSSLGQNFLFDQPTLKDIVSAANITSNDNILEVGPGLGTLTGHLLEEANSVTAVEFDDYLASNLINNLSKIYPNISQSILAKLKVENCDFLNFDLANLEKDYKVVANIPYNITSKIIQKLLTASNAPSLSVLLVQKEVAERLAAQPGKLSLLAISAQVFAEVKLGAKVPAHLFMPAPKVDSQVVILKKHPKPLVAKNEQDKFFQIVRAGFSEKRKKLHSSLATGLMTNKTKAKTLLVSANIDPNKRAQELTIDDWIRLTATVSLPL